MQFTRKTADRTCESKAQIDFLACEAGTSIWSDSISFRLCCVISLDFIQSEISLRRTILGFLYHEDFHLPRCAQEISYKASFIFFENTFSKVHCGHAHGFSLVWKTCLSSKMTSLRDLMTGPLLWTVGNGGQGTIHYICMYVQHGTQCV